MRLATWHGDLSRDGPGLLLRDLLRGDEDSAIQALAQIDPDVLLLTDMDYDHGLAALDALAAQLEAHGASYPHRLALAPNSGQPTGRDLDKDGRLGGPRDAQGYGEFSGQHGMALLSRLPIAVLRDFSDILWRDVPDNAQQPGDAAPDIQRLSSTGHWMIEVQTGDGPITLMAFAATPPVFDGPEDRNGRRNRDEVLFWKHTLDGRHGPAPPAPVLIGNANIDPARGDGRREAIATLLDDPRLQDPQPDVATVTWDGTGPMRVSYILPSAHLDVTETSVTPIPDHRHLAVSVTIDGN